MANTHTFPTYTLVTKDALLTIARDQLLQVESEHARQWFVAQATPNGPGTTPMLDDLTERKDKLQALVQELEAQKE